MLAFLIYNSQMPSPKDYLISIQHESGGWGYSRSHRPVVEPTAVAILALRSEPGANESIQRGISWLLSCQNADGGWGIHEDDPESGWQTAWALIALRYTNQDQDMIIRAAEWLAYVGTYHIQHEQFQKSEIPENANPGSMVWPWLPGQAGWIEPTALAVLALEGLIRPPFALTRINAALAYFRKYRTPSGGWDMGNASAIDNIIFPRSFQTALVLMALSRVAPQEIKPNDISVMREDLMRDQDVLFFSAGYLAIKTLGESDEMLLSYLKENQIKNGSWEDNPFFTAWAMMALRGYL